MEAAYAQPGMIQRRDAESPAADSVNASVAINGQLRRGGRVSPSAGGLPVGHHATLRSAGSTVDDDHMDDAAHINDRGTVDGLRRVGRQPR